MTGPSVLWVEASPLSRREIVRRPGTSASLLHRLLNLMNYRKSLDQVLSPLHALDCEVDFGVGVKSARASHTHKFAYSK